MTCDPVGHGVVRADDFVWREPDLGRALHMASSLWLSPNVTRVSAFSSLRNAVMAVALVLWREPSSSQNSAGE